MSAPALRTRKPTGKPPYPLVLIEGPEKAGKSLIPVVLSRSPRVGMVYWLDLGEGAADEYAALPESDYLVVEHDGTYRDILEQITAVHNEAKRAADAGEPPVVIVVDSMSALWTMLVNWTNERARRSNNGRQKLAADPDAEIDPTSNLWNDANGRHKRVMDLLMTFPGIAVVTARGKQVAKMENGQPARNGATEWKVEGQKNLAFDVTAWVQVKREPRTANLVGARSLQVTIPASGRLPMPMVKVGDWDVCDLDAFIFDTMGCESGQVRDLPPLRGDELEGIYSEIEVAPTEDDLRAIWDRASKVVTPDQSHMVSEAVTRRLEALRAPSPAAGATEASLGAHGPASDAEKLRQAADAAEAEQLMGQSEDKPSQDGAHQ